MNDTVRPFLRRLTTRRKKSMEHPPCLRPRSLALLSGRPHRLPLSTLTISSTKCDMCPLKAALFTRVVDITIIQSCILTTTAITLHCGALLLARATRRHATCTTHMNTGHHTYH